LKADSVARCALIFTPEILIMLEEAALLPRLVANYGLVRL
jgi:hypothetical protein